MQGKTQLRQNQVKGGSGWTEERCALLKKLWAEGYSCSQIARRLGNTTRNAVIGKRIRMGLPDRLTPTKPMCRPSRRAKASISKRAIPPLPKVKRSTANNEPRRRPPKRKITVPEPDTKGIPFEQIDNSTCKWPLGDGPPYSFCGCKPAEGSAYCEHHTQRAAGKHSGWGERTSFVGKERVA
ncbi:GcrA family cell cycle regulator [Henriciella pelagia]|uniref:GcrA family cell cycle regulator n=1 Tax=Henriciella pelagia TaxID=1977912 RepID=UPI003514C3D3